ncbi:MAG: flagellar biosynthesis protein FlhA [Deltaproteobacteria bacterium]|nr:flagellar biosynthesis protein FlhA [Deltaproteobacteria bacterium]
MAVNNSQKALNLSILLKNSDFIIALGVVGILAIMILPMPTPLLDLMLAFNITCSVVIIFVSIYILQPLDFSIFPSILLMATLFRLSLNVASTRLILLHGSEGMTAAGHIIKTFGTFVVGGNYVVGFVVFLILVVINFVVITKGSGRIAEVAARFTLDAMPGKQMSIDADLNAGLITDAEARKRRLVIAREADFYGAMDGASKFVRGDAIAGIIITMINILGGLIIGVLQQGMSLATAAKNYTILTIGDGLVTQMPSLIVSTAAGIVVTRAASEESMGRELIGQIMGHYKAIGLTAVILFLMGWIPGLPKLSFMTLALILGAMTYVTLGAEREAQDRKKIEAEAEKAVPFQEGVELLLPLDILELEVGYGLIPLVDQEQDGDLLERIKAIRRQFALDLGIIVPPMHIRDNLELKPYEYAILIKGVRIGQGELMPGHYMAMDPGTVETKIDGLPTQEPAFNLSALWIKEEDREKAQRAGYTVADLSTVIATHLFEVIKAHAHELLSRQEVQKLLDRLSQEHPKVIEELIPNRFSLGQVVKVLQNLLKEGVSIRDLLTILETLADYTAITKNIVLLTEYVRQALARSITKQYIGPDRRLFVLTLEQKAEDLIAESIRHNEHDSYLSIEPNAAQQILMALKNKLERLVKPNLHPIILCSPVVRPYFKKLTERFIPHLVVLSHNEIAPDIWIESIGTVGFEHAN